ncbi:MAG: TrmH family RNA methyltransferase [Treponema sp.]|nr:TrmH family RNA methyltransferase [Treponema sp.]
MRKICKIFAETENRMALSSAERFYLADILKLLIAGENFSVTVRETLESARKILGSALTEETDAGSSSPEQSVVLHRAVNTVRHVLLRETGRSPADWDFTDPKGVPDPATRQLFPGMTVYLEDIRSPFNVGAMFRSAESFGAEKIILSPLCADPRHPRAPRTAMGCVEILSYERMSIEELKNLSLPCFALETGGTLLQNFIFPEKAVMLSGSEELGLSPEALALADTSLGRLSIPLYGAKGSLNVSVAFGIAMQAWAAKEALIYSIENKSALL